MWFFLSLGTAVCAGTADALSKNALGTFRVPTMALVRSGYAAFFLVPFLLLAPSPLDPEVFWKNVAMAMPLEIVAIFGYQTALQISPLSLTVPYLAFTPVFLLGFGWLFLGESLSLLGILGILFVTAGAFFIQATNEVRHPVALLKSTLREKGSLLMLTVSLIYAITSVFAKKAVMASSPAYFSGMYLGLLAVCLLPFQRKGGAQVRDLVRRPGLFAGIGALEALTFLLQFEAFLQAQVAYAIAVKRLSLLLAVFYGRVFFKEANLLPRLAGAAIMVAGATMIAFA